jgi:hypothetical protein
LLPVVPKVRVGDVLYATRNLRNWLQTASLMYSVKHVRDGGSLRNAKSVIYTPKRGDKYVVCVNAGKVFSVFVVDRDLTLFFVNAPQGPDPKRKVLKHGTSTGRVVQVLTAPSPGYGAPVKSLTDRDSSDRMSPAIFSTWFVRSDEKMPDLRMWPDPNYAAWVSLQMNAISLNGDYRLAIQIPRQHDALFYQKLDGLGAFGNGKRSKDRGTVRQCLQQAIKVGMTRQKHQTGHFNTMTMNRASGPRMEEIDYFRKDIKGWMKNPRTRKNLEAKLSGNDAATISQILEGLQKND